MPGQALGLGQDDGVRAERPQRGGRHAHGVHVLAEVVSPQRRGEPRRPVRGQHVVGPGHVVAHAGRRPGAEEDGAGVADLVEQGAARSSSTISSRCSGATVFATAMASSGPSTRQATRMRRGWTRDRRARGDVATRRSDLALDLLEHRVVPGHEPGQAVRPVLGLDDQVDGGEGGRRPGSRHDDDLGGPGEGGGHPDQPGDLTLGLGHVRVPRTGDDVDGGHALGAVGQRAHRLGPPDPVHLVDARDRGGGQRGVVDTAARRGRAARTGRCCPRPPPWPGRRT